MISRHARRILLGGARRSFLFWQRMGLHVTPVHFYQPVPDTRTLGPDIWRRQSAMVGVDIDDQAQIPLLRRLSDQYRGEIERIPRAPTSDPARYYLDNGSFESVDGEILYLLIRSLKPRRMIEVGSGMSTLLAAEALRMNERDGADPCEYVAIDPYPGPTVRAGVTGLTKLLEQPVQGVPLAQFEPLGPNDILFIDSSHVLAIGSDVQHLLLEVIPRLAPGAYVHIHDIFMPSEYPRQWVINERRFYTEQYLLQAFLAFNAAWQVVWAGSYMHLRHPEQLSAAFPSYGPHRHPGSFWMVRRPVPDPPVQKHEAAQ